MLGAGGGLAKMGGVPPIFAGILYLVLAIILYLYPSLKLSAYAAAIRRLRQTGSATDLQAALDAQRGFWKYAGILVMIIVILYLIVFLFAVFASMLG